jgi:N-acetylglucosamine kinase-like BadF-type ATPase
MDKFGIEDLGQMIEGLYLGQYHPDSLDALMVFRIAHEGDPAAIEVVRWAGEKLGDMACGVIRQLEFEDLDFEVVLIGSLYDGHPLLIDSMRETILQVAPHASLVKLDVPPVVGGVLLGMEVAGFDFLSSRPNLIMSAKAMFRKRNSGIAVKQP